MSKPVIEIAPCPFCGQQPCEVKRKPAGMDVAFAIDCKCGASFSPFVATEEDCTNAWNQRAGFDIAGIEGASGLYYTRMLAVANGEQKIEPLYRVKK